MIYLEEIINLRRIFLKKYHNLEFYPFQEEVSNEILKQVFGENRQEMFCEVARQGGKTEAVVKTVEFLLLFYKSFTGKPIRIGIFAPQHEQAKTDFDRLKEALEIPTIRNGFELTFPESNATTLNVWQKGINYGFCYIFPITLTSKPESKTLDLIIFEESQYINSRLKAIKIDPMGANTNAVKASFGSAGFEINYFYRGIQANNNCFIYPYQEIIKQKEIRKELEYKEYVEKEFKEKGEDDDAIKTQYKLEWVIGVGQFIIIEQFNKLQGEFDRTHSCKIDDCWAGIDTAKDPDSTIVTILRFNKERNQKEIANWLELRGDNYKDQFDIIWNFLQRYNIKALAIDSTGQGDFMPDMFERETYFINEASGLYRVKFSLPQKDILYKNLLTVIRNFLTKVPKCGNKESDRFRQQLLDLQKEYKGGLLSCHHPNQANCHDDYADSWALAEYAYFKDQERGEPDIR